MSIFANEKSVALLVWPSRALCRINTGRINRIWAQRRNVIANRITGAQVGSGNVGLVSRDVSLGGDRDEEITNWIARAFGRIDSRGNLKFPGNFINGDEAKRKLLKLKSYLD